MTWEGLTPPYRTIVADPPWPYRKSPNGGEHQRRTAEDNYATMRIAEIRDLPVAALAAPDAHLYLWATVPRLFHERNDDTSPGPYDVMRAWGFRYVTLLTWRKGGAPGMGNYFRIDSEHVLFGVRGSCPIPADQRVSTVFDAPRRGHAVKPPEFFDLVERVSPGPYVELFARQPRLGWDHWGYGYEGAG